MSFDDADHDIVAVLLPGAGLLQHLVSLADAGRGTDEDFEAAGVTLFPAGRLEQGLRRRSLVKVAPLIRHQEPSFRPCKATHSSSVRLRAIQRQIERQYVHPRFAQQAEGTALDMLVHKLAHAIFRHVARFRNPRHLEKRRRRRDVRIKPAARGGHQVDRDLRRGILLLELVDVALDAFDQGLVGGSQIGPAGIRRVVGRGNSLGRVRWGREQPSPTAGRGNTCRS